MTDVRLVVTNPEDSSVVPAACNAKGELLLEEPITFDGNLDGDLSVSGSITAEGAASFAGTVKGNSNNAAIIGGDFRANSPNPGIPAVQARNFDDDGDVFQGRKANGLITTEIGALGHATFASASAGFTDEGYLWCTTRRGNVVILDATSNGLATWADYTPPTRRNQAADKLEALGDELNTISQDLPETPTETP